jgi:hypothetical protein
MSILLELFFNLWMTPGNRSSMVEMPDWLATMVASVFDWREARVWYAWG